MDPFSYYPSDEELEDWIDRIWQTAVNNPVKVSVFPVRNERATFFPHQMHRTVFYQFEQDGMEPFCGIFTPCSNGPRPLVVHTPGYGAGGSFHPEIIGENYNVLELSPLGYWTPNGDRRELAWEGTTEWPVLPNTAMDHNSLSGYYGWLVNAVAAIRWAMEQPSVEPNRVSFFGTSQGGGGSLLLGSIFRDRGTRCVCAEEPFLTDFPLANWRGAYGVAHFGFKKVSPEVGWHNLGFVDTLRHAERMTYPVMLTVGTADGTCPPETIACLFEKLNAADKMFLSMKDQGHGYHLEFIRHVLTWLSLYA